MNFIFDLVPTLLVLGILILVHELGHFIACRLAGVRVEKFSIGFGPEILRIQGKETRYAISLLPFGGYVKPSGESLSEISAEGPRPYDYVAAPVAKRIFIVTAGVGMNYLLSFLLFIAILVMGRPVPTSVVGGFVKGYPAEASGLAKGDRVAAVEGLRVDSWEDLTDVLGKVTAADVELDIEREGNRLKLRVPLRVEAIKDIFGQTHKLSRLGILPDSSKQQLERLPVTDAIREAFLMEIHLTGMTYKGIFYLMTGRLSLRTISGPIGIMAMAGTAAKMGLVYVLHLAAILGISLAVVNLLPIPALDGGHLLFLLIEGIKGRGVSLEFQERATQIGFAVLMILMVLVIYNDLVNLQVIERVKTALTR